MGTVYHAIDERTGGEVALKRLRGGDPRLLALFEREYRTLVGIQHPRIIRAYEYGVDASGPYYTMELARGRDLHELAPLPLVDACLYLRDVATCLALLHTRRLLHRDVSPRNVRVLPSGECKLLDFGALSSFGVCDRVIGTPPYIPPEALGNGPLDQRADVFSFGALLYWTLTRKHAYPARRIEDLPEAWKRRPLAPSSIVPELSPRVDALVLGLLAVEPSSRPATMTEVVERLNGLAQLPTEDADTQQALAASYLVQAELVGHEQELTVLRERLEALVAGRGGAMFVTGPSGVGRSRLLREMAERGQLAGVRTVLVDAGTHRHANGAAIAIVQRLLDLSPAARHEAESHSASLAELDRGLAERLGIAAAAPQGRMSGDWRARIQEMLFAIVAAATTDARVLLLVDNLDDADDGSLAMLAGLLRLTTLSPLMLVCSAQSSEPDRNSMPWRLIVERSQAVVLSPLSAVETLALTRSLFGDAPNVVRFAEWLHQHTGGLPLHCMELVRRLHASGDVRYLDGMWALPSERPASVVTGVLSDLLAESLDALSPSARSLAEALAVERGSLSRERCLAHAQVEGQQPFALLDELVRQRVIEDALQGGYRFAHRVLRDALLTRMTPERRRRLHLRCAEWELLHAPTDKQTSSRIEAGWHLLQAGEESRGAHELAAVAYDTLGVRFAFADLQIAAPALEAALGVYTKQGRHLHERLPLIAALAQAGYYEARIWGDRYGDTALAAVAEVSGLTLAKKLVPWMGKTLGLLAGMSIAWVRFSLRPGRVRNYRFVDVLVQLFGVVTTLTGAASIALDVARAEHVAATLAPFRHLPARLTPVGIAQFCEALKEIGRENQAYALRACFELLERFKDPSYYRALPDAGRPLYLGGLWFARGVFESFRDGGGALHAADELDRLDLKLYRMIASAIRALHYANRGQLDLARRHREQVDVHAIQIGSAWQVELWEPAAMILVHTTMCDVVEMRRVVDRLNELSRAHPSLARYARMAELALVLARDDELADRGQRGDGTATGRALVDALELLQREAPRSFIGWGAVCGYVARALNLLERHAEAKACAEQALSHLRPEDRPFVALFLNVEIELALANAALGNHTEARRQMDDLLAFHHASDNPLTRGRLHVAFAQVAARAGDWTTFRHHAEEARGWFQSTGASVLIARVDRLRALDPARSNPPPRPSNAPLEPRDIQLTRDEPRRRDR